MTAATATAPAGPRYAPEDPTLPKPWKGLVDGRTGYLYFWNPETNVTQYERPTPPPSQLGPVSSASPAHLTSSVEGQKPSVLQHTQSNHNVDGGNQHYRGSTDERSYQSDRVGTAYTQGALDRAAASVSFVSQGSSGAGDGLSADAYRRKHEITVIGGNVPPPFMSFDAATGFPPELLREVQQAGFSAPTPIQAQSWPIALQGEDIVAIAKTGSGKTLGYLIPGFIHLKKCRNDPQIGPTVLVLSPTRELATQIQDEAMKFGRSSRILCVCLYGGAPKGPQLRDLDRGVDIVVATPGRLNDILEMKRLNLDQISYLVLDEADRMLDMGFEPQIRKILKEVPSRRQTLMFTATWPKEVRKIAAEFFVNPYQVNIGNVDELVANKSITQHVEVISPYEKQRRLEEILRSQEPGSKIIVFCATKRMCDMLAGKLDRNFGAAAIHGDKSQADRDFVLNQFRSGRCPILVATDVAARGLDVKDIRVVVNYDFPTGIEDYIHRIGRTGRAGATGAAYTFFNDQDSKHASDLVKILEGANQKVPQKVREMAANSGGMRGPRRWGPSSGGGYDGGRGGGGARYDSGGGYGGRGGGGRYDSGGGYGGSRGGRGSDRYGGGGGDSYGRYGGGRNRSPSPPSKGQGGGWGSRDRSRSPGPAAAAVPAGMSFHQMMMEKYRSSG